MKRKIIKIDESKCNGCGYCVKKCHEGALEIVNGKAKLVSDKYCDGLGDCIGECPLGAITFEVRETEDYDEKAVIERQTAKLSQRASKLINWPLQLHLQDPAADYFYNADVVLAADCTAFAFGNLVNKFQNKIISIACPKLDSNKEVYIDKLVSLINISHINSLTVVMMEVPCCNGLLYLSQQALSKSKRKIPIKKVIISIKGDLLKEEWVNV
ncbi:MAG: 4Fe-4S dicluster domain-containing protein [Bacteroidales bacterium]|nr:4Fe-4S dicluster domain-containing protein [Bacteroidales bacterium]